MILLLLLFQGFKTVLFPSMFFPINEPTSLYFSHVHNLSLSYGWKTGGDFIPGIYGEIFQKNNDLYSDPYLRKSGLSLKLFSYCLGGNFEYKLNDKFSVGSGIGIYTLYFKYPFAKDNGEIDYKNNRRTYLGLYAAFSFSKPFVPWRIGVTMKVYQIGENVYPDTYYGYPPYDYYENTPFFPTPLQGFSLGLTLGYEK
jgi:hypothetical protein